MYDVIIVGGGPGGYAAALRAAQLKAKVAFIENISLGGTCVARGCIPSKLWLHAAGMLEQSRKAADFGLDLTVGPMNYAALVERKQGVSDNIRMGIEGRLASLGVDVIMGTGTLVSATKVQVGTESYEAKNIIVATGSTLARPTLAGIDAMAFTSDDALNMKDIPASVLITDATYIGVEFATLFSLLGSTVVFAVPETRILPTEDQDTSQRIAQALRERGVKILARHTLTAVAANGCTLKSGDKEQVIKVDKVFISQRKPVTEGLGLEALGIGFNDDGGIKVNEQCRTACSTVFAVGDCTGGLMLSHVASAMGNCAADNCMGKMSKFSAHLASRAMWGMPEMGSVGLSEEQAERQGYDVEVGGFPYAYNGYAMLRGDVDGAVKMVSDAKTGEILGVHIVGANATELIGEAVLAMQLECTVSEFAKGIRVHPTFSETLVDSAHDLVG